MKVKNKITKFMNKKLLLILAIPAALLVSVSFVVYSMNNDNSEQTQDENTIENIVEENSASSDPTLVPEAKKQNEDESDNVDQESPEIIVVDSSQYEDEVEIRAYIGNYVRDGECTFIFSYENNSFEISTPARADASTTQCGSAIVPLSRFSNQGTWQVDILYEAGSISAKTESEVQVTL